MQTNEGSSSGKITSFLEENLERYILPVELIFTPVIESSSTKLENEAVGRTVKILQEHISGPMEKRVSSGAGAPKNIIQKSKEK